MFTEKLRDGWFLHLSFGHCKHHIDKRLIRHLAFDTIHRQKDKSCGCPNAFVSVKKWMVLHEVKEIGRRHFIQITVQIVPSESCLWGSHCRFQQSVITDSHCPTMPFNFTTVNLQHFLQCEKQRFHSLFRKFLQRRTVLPIYLG